MNEDVTRETYERTIIMTLINIGLSTGEFPFERIALRLARNF